MYMNITLETDSGDYHLLTKGVELSRNTDGLTCEIGLRRGGGTKFIMDALAKYGKKVHIAIDPYGSIEYEHKEGEVVRLDYTNQMRNECLSNLHAYAEQVQVPLLFWNLEDTEFFKRYSDGVPIYNQVKSIVNQYSFIHFDGPHAFKPLLAEIDFFKSRTPVGGCWCFDDVKGYYDHDAVEAEVLKLGFNLIEKGDKKALYQKVK